MITGVILTHNEEKNIEKCIAHLRPHVGELILVDTESTDRTVELARPLVDQVLLHPHVANFDAARNLAIPVARHEWLWFVDADEFIPELTGQLVNQWIREHGDEFEAINIPFKSYFCGRWIQHCGWWPGYTCPRVLKRGHFEFSPTLHAGVKLTGREVRVPPDARTGIEHYSFRDLAHWVEKANRYTSTEALQLAKRGITYDWRGALRFMVHDLWEHYELNHARLDGERGWILTWCAAMYRWLSVAKLIDHGQSSEQRGGPSSVPADLDEFMRAFEQELASFRADWPVVPLGVLWRGPLWDASAAAQESRHCIQAIAAGRRTLSVESLPGDVESELPLAERTLLRALCRARRGRSVVTVTQWSSLILPPDPCASHNVLRVPAGCVVTPPLMGHVNAYDELWVESPEQVPGLREAGAAPERISLIPALCEPTSAEEGAASAKESIDSRLAGIDARFSVHRLPEIRADQIRVAIEGEFFASHSFSNINEELARRLAQDPGIALSLARVRHQPTDDRRSLTRADLVPYFGRPLGEGPELTIRHAFPPNWQRPATGKWVHIQPWEFGSLPNDWVNPLRHEVDEVWVMSRYVERVYRDSGVAPEKLHYIPWGINPEVFNPSAPARRLPTDKTFRFLFVGGTILRKGFDRVLSAYLAEFTAKDDVCLVVKDLGATSFYKPQSIRDQIRAAQSNPANPAILYLDEDMTPGQLASLYTACHCLVAPYRGEGFGLPILESLACGVPPIVPVGGPTDDFVDWQSGFILPSRFIDAEGVPNLCGPATELHVEEKDLRVAMHRACVDRQKTRRLGLTGSQRVRREFTWERTARLIAKRVEELAGRPIVPPANAPTAKMARPRLAVLIRNAHDPRQLVETLARVGPFVDSLAVEPAGSDERVPLLAREYGARLAHPVDAALVIDTDWILELAEGEYLDDSELDSLKWWLQDQPDHVRQAMLLESDGDGIRPQRLRRLSETNDTHTVCIEAPFTIRRVAGRPSATTKHEAADRAVEARPTRELAATEAASQPTIRPNAGGSRYGRLRKSVLIQMACGPHLELLDRTHDHHRRYAQRQGMDYWSVAGNPVFGKRPGWGKVPLILAGIDAGYESVIWLDADAVIVRPEVNLTQLVSEGIGMVRHPNPEHWNTGFVVARSCENVERFWREVEAAPENGHAWMEQAAANALATMPRFADLLHPLELRYNSVPGFASANEPVIVAAHGLPHHVRVAILERALSEYARTAAPQLTGLPKRRSEFGDFLNCRGLIGEAVEVGVQRGEFAHTLLGRWNGRLLHLVDPWRRLPDYIDIANGSDTEHEANLEETRRALARYEGRYQVHRALSAEAVQRFADEALDFVYLDANHSFESVSQDLRLWFPKVKRGGVLAGHDFLDGDLPEGRFGVASAVQAFQRETDLALQVTDEPWRSWFFIKN